MEEAKEGVIHLADLSSEQKEHYCVDQDEVQSQQEKDYEIYAQKIADGIRKSGQSSLSQPAKRSLSWVGLRFGPLRRRIMHSRYSMHPSLIKRKTEYDLACDGILTNRKETKQLSRFLERVWGKEWKSPGIIFANGEPFGTLVPKDIKEGDQDMGTIPQDTQVEEQKTLESYFVGKSLDNINQAGVTTVEEFLELVKANVVGTRTRFFKGRANDRYYRFLKAKGIKYPSNGNADIPEVLLARFGKSIAQRLANKGVGSLQQTLEALKGDNWEEIKDCFNSRGPGSDKLGIFLRENGITLGERAQPEEPEDSEEPEELQATPQIEEPEDSEEPEELQATPQIEDVEEPIQQISAEELAEVVRTTMESGFEEFFVSNGQDPPEHSADKDKDPMASSLRSLAQLVQRADVERVSNLLSAINLSTTHPGARNMANVVRAVRQLRAVR